MLSQKTLSKLEEMKAKKIMLQFPEGLKTRAIAFSDFLEEKGYEVFISCEPSYGACDIRDHDAKMLGCDVLLHIGHSDFGVRPELPVIYEEYSIDYDPVPLLEQHINDISYTKIGLVSTVQFKNIISPAKEFLEKSGKEVFTGKQARSQNEGHILGCDWTAALPLEKDVECFLYIGSGFFHPFGLALKTDKPVLVLDIETKELKDLSKEKTLFERKRAYAIEQAKDSRIFGILITSKPGQLYMGLAKKARQQLLHLQKKPIYLVMDNISPDKMLGMNIEILVNCACPRINEDMKLFGKPILNPEDVTKLVEDYEKPIQLQT